MKKILMMAAVFMSIFFYGNAGAQVRVNVNVNIGSQPVWGPVGYDYAEYYYLPDVDAYYYVPRHQYIYQDEGRWIYASALPGRYNYDPYRSYKVVVNEPRPYLHDDIYRSKYGKYKGRYNQQEIIRDSRDQKYYVVKGHPMYGRGHDNEDHDQGNHGNHGNGHGNGHGRGHGHDQDR